MKMELHPTAWLSDTDGLKLAESTNVHLPPTIRVFEVVPVTREGTRFTISQCAGCIGVVHLLPKFLGKNNSRRRSPLQAKPDVALEPEHHEPQVETLNVNANLLANMLDVKAYWLNAPNKADKLGPSHFRRVFECSCGALEVGSGARFIRISITGETLMVHQIRKMVATAVGVARGLLSHHHSRPVSAHPSYTSVSSFGGFAPRHELFLSLPAVTSASKWKGIS